LVENRKLILGNQLLSEQNNIELVILSGP